MDDEEDYKFIDDDDTKQRDELLKRLYYIIQKACDDILQWNKPGVESKKMYVQWEKDYEALRQKVRRHVETTHILIDQYMEDEWRKIEETPDYYDLDDWMTQG